MGLFLIGVNHQTAPLDLREQVAYDPTTIPALLASLCKLEDIAEAMILSTCNRTEIYYAGASADTHSADDWIHQNSNRSDELIPSLYRKGESEVITHACRVAAGLDSKILGEPQIFGQLKIAFRVAHENRAIGPNLHRLFQHAFLVAKNIRTHTSIGESAVSAASAAVGLAQQVYDNFSSKQALMIGAGEMIETASGHLLNRNIGSLVIANRSSERGRALANKLNCRFVNLDRIAEILPNSDMVFSSTASPRPIVSAAQISTALKSRKRKPMFIVDLAVPRDIDPLVADFSDVFLYTIDDLHQAVGDNLEARRAAANEAELIIHEFTDSFARGIDGLEAVPVIRELRDQADLIKSEVLTQAQRQLTAGKPPEEILKWATDAIANKLLHQPSTALRQAGEKSDAQLLELARRLYGLNQRDDD